MSIHPSSATAVPRRGACCAEHHASTIRGPAQLDLAVPILGPPRGAGDLLRAPDEDPGSGRRVAPGRRRRTRSAATAPRIRCRRVVTDGSDNDARDVHHRPDEGRVGAGRRRRSKPCWAYAHRRSRIRADSPTWGRRGAASYVPVVARRYVAGRGYRSEFANDPEWCDFAQLQAAHVDGCDGAALVALVDRRDRGRPLAGARGARDRRPRAVVAVVARARRAVSAASRAGRSCGPHRWSTSRAICARTGLAGTGAMLVGTT